jgi:murein DD-endopeptidase MepM/ murein hydrolase activator NlpD
MFGVIVVSSAAPTARAAASSRLAQSVAPGRQRVSSLTDAVATASHRVTALSASIAATSRRLASLQRAFEGKRVASLALRSQQSAAQARLTQLQAVAARAEHALAQQVVGSYEGTTPDIVSVVVEAPGFNDLLEQLNFAERVGRRDAQIAARTAAARRAVATEAVRVGTVSFRAQQLAVLALNERNRVGALKLALVSEKLAAARSPATAAGQLTAATSPVTALIGQLARLKSARPTVIHSTVAPPSAPVARGFEFPLPTADVPPPSTWTLEDGVDVAASGGTPELAVCAGTVVLHGVGDFGPSAPVIHCDQPLAGHDYVYYGQAGPAHWVPVGTHLARGQVIAEVGPGIVGISAGPHLEIGFADAAGTPIGASSAPAMMSLLRAAYAA